MCACMRLMCWGSHGSMFYKDKFTLNRNYIHFLTLEIFIPLLIFQKKDENLQFFFMYFFCFLFSFFSSSYLFSVFPSNLIYFCQFPFHMKCYYLIQLSLRLDLCVTCMYCRISLLMLRMTSSLCGITTWTTVAPAPAALLPIMCILTCLKF